MYALNVYKCGGVTCNNTGQAGCEFIPGLTKGAILTPYTKVFTEAEILVFKDTLQALQADDNPDKRIYPVKIFTDVEDTGTDEVTDETGFGDSHKVRDGKFGWSWRLDNSLCHWKKLRNFDGNPSAYRVILIDDDRNVFWGTQKDGGFAGFEMTKLSIPRFNNTTGSTRFHFMFNVMLKNIKEMENSAIILMDQDVDVMNVVNGLIDVTVKVNTPLAAGVIKMEALEGCGATSMFGLYQTNLSQTGAWKFYNVTQNQDVTVLSVGTTATDIWDVTLDPANYTTGDVLKVSLSEPSHLAGAPVNMPGYDSCPITITVP